MQTDSVLFYLISGALLGLSGGLAPGPLTALVISQTLRFGFKEGAVIAFAPMLTDGPLVVLSALAITSASAVGGFLGGLSMAGALFLAWLAWDTLRSKPLEVEGAHHGSPGSVRKALLTNVLNPHPYMFWFIVGGPLIARAWELGPGHATAFLVSFFGSIVGAKLALAWLTARFKHLLRGRGYLWTMRVLGVALACFAVVFAVDGGERLQWW